MKPFCLYKLLFYFLVLDGLRVFASLNMTSTFVLRLIMKLPLSLQCLFGSMAVVLLLGWLACMNLTSSWITRYFFISNTKSVDKVLQLQGGRCDSKLPPRSMGGAQPWFWQGFRKSRIEGPGLSLSVYTQFPFVEGPGLSFSLPNSPLLRDHCDNCSSHEIPVGTKDYFTFRCSLYSGSRTTLHILEEILRRSPFGARALELGDHFDYTKIGNLLRAGDQLDHRTKNVIIGIMKQDHNFNHHHFSDS